MSESTDILTIPINVATVEPNVLGELLRDLLFDQKNGEELGCYATFDLRDGWFGWPGASLMDVAHTTIGQEHGWDVDDWNSFKEEWSNAEGCWKIFGTIPIHAAWYWDGDGTLAFGIGDPYRRIVINPDCKKPYEWEDAPCG